MADEQYLSTDPNAGESTHNYKIVQGPDGKISVFKKDDGDATISGKLGAIPEQNASKFPNAPTWRALTMQSAAKSVAPAETALEEIATSPTFAKNAGKLANAATTAGEVGRGVLTGSLADVVAAPRLGYAAGRGGYWIGRGIQAVAAPAAKVAGAVAPYAQIASTLSGAIGVGELAQMAEPNRSDIGTMGIGSSNTVAAQRATVMRAQIQALVNEGMSINDALRKVSEAWRAK